MEMGPEIKFADETGKRLLWRPSGTAAGVFYWGEVAVWGEDHVRIVIVPSLFETAMRYLRAPGAEWYRRHPGMIGITSVLDWPVAGLPAAIQAVPEGRAIRHSFCADIPEMAQPLTHLGRARYEVVQEGICCVSFTD